MCSPPRKRDRKTQKKYMVYGQVENFVPGSKWARRQECSEAGVHAPPVAGISGTFRRGAYSVVLSGGYVDNIDKGDTFTYTGSGGREKGVRIGPQVFDQAFNHKYNKILNTSVLTGNPVRVIRGFTPNSPYAPFEGYRYDGLYTVTRAWMDIGKSSKQICRYQFRRIPGQPALPVRYTHFAKEELPSEEDDSSVRSASEMEPPPTDAGASPGAETLVPPSTNPDSNTTDKPGRLVNGASGANTERHKDSDSDSMELWLGYRIS